jgi:hypothetical protein
MNQMQKMIPLLLVSAVLGACGGGGGSSTPAPAPAPAPVPAPAPAPAPASSPTGSITSTTLPAVSSDAYSSSQLLTGVYSFASAAIVQTDLNKIKFDLKSLIDLQQKEALSFDFQPVSAVGAVTTKTFPCSLSGTYTGTVNDADASGTATAGDILSLTYNNCVTGTTASNFTRNGNSTSTFTKIVGTPSATTSYELAIATTYQNLSISLSSTTGTLAINGSIATSTLNNPVGDMVSSMTAPALQFTSGGSLVAGYTNYTMNETVSNSIASKPYVKSGQGTVTNAAGGTFNLSTPVAFKGNGSGNPSEGQLKIVGSNSTAYVTAIDTFSARLDLDTGSDGTIDFTQSVAWSAL